MEIYTNQIREWTDYENQYKIAVAAVKWLDKSLRIVHGKRERNVELTYGLPYTSSGEYAAIWNTNVDARSLSDSDLQFKGVALDKDNNPVIIWYMTDCDGWKYTTMNNFNELKKGEKSMKKQKQSAIETRRERRRRHFWAWMMDHFPKTYDWLDRHLPCDTLPF